MSAYNVLVGGRRRLWRELTPWQQREALRLTLAVLSAATVGSCAGVVAVLGEERPVALVTVTDVSGLWPGRSVSVHAMAPWGDALVTGRHRGMARADHAAVLLDACGQPLASSSSVTLLAGALRSWVGTARLLGGLPLWMTTEGQAVVHSGPGDVSAEGVSVLGCLPVLGAGSVPEAPRTWEGALLEALEDLVIPVPDHDGGLVEVDRLSLVGGGVR